MNRTRNYLVGSVLTAVAVGASMALFASSAGAATSNAISANTHAANHDDTTSVSGNATIASPGGPVWAYDNLKVAITATPANATDGNYLVVLTVTGSFAGFANPRTADELATAGLPAVPAPGDTLISSGSIKGTYNLTVQSATPPKASNLAPQQDPTTGLGSMVNQLFGGSATVSGGNYNFVYTKVEGVTYTQTG
jgi:hypothetical protein